jgi:hypothetical protein
MKRYFFVAVVVFAALTLVVGAAYTHAGRAEMKRFLQAGDGGGPIPTCRPGANCGPNTQLQQLAG